MEMEIGPVRKRQPSAKMMAFRQSGGWSRRRRRSSSPVPMGIEPLIKIPKSRGNQQSPQDQESTDEEYKLFNEIEPEAEANGAAAIPIGSGDGHEMSEWQKLSMPTDHKWSVIHGYATGLWPVSTKKESSQSTVYVGNTILHPDFLWMTDWYEQLPDDLSDPAILTRTLDITKEKLKSLGVNMINDTEYRSNGYTGLRAWVQFCNRNRNGNYALDDIMVIREFLEQRVEHFRANPKADSSRKGVIRESAMWDSYRKTVNSLRRMACWQGYFNNLSEEEVVKTMSRQLIQDRNKAREQPQDYYKTSRHNTTRYTTNEKNRRLTVLWSGAAIEKRKRQVEAEMAMMRTFGMIILNSLVGRRGMDIRQIRFAMLLMHTLEHVKPVECVVVGAGIRRVKEQSGNEEHLLGWCRGADRLSCGVMALAMMVVWRLDIFRYPRSPRPPESVGGRSILFPLMKRDLLARKAWLALDPKTRGPEPVSEWWKVVVFHASSETEPIASTTHREDYNAVLDAAEIEGKTKVTHMDRPDAACDMMERANVDFSDVGLYFGWHHDVAADKYLKASFKTAALLDAAGWESSKEFFAWQVGKESDIPETLLKAVMPELEELEELANEVGEDRSAIEVIKTLKYLRVVYLQEAVYSRNHHEDFPAFKHPVFKMPEWASYAEAEERRTEERKSEYYYKLRDPAVAEMYQEQLDRLHEERKREREAAQIQHESMMALIRSMEQRMARMTMAPTLAPAGMAGMDDTEMEMDLESEDEPKAAAESGKPPFIPEPKSLDEAYCYWVTECRDFFRDCGRPKWESGRDGSSAKAQKDRNQRMQPCFRYLDSLGFETGQLAIKALTAFQVSRKMKTCSFLKKDLYNLVQGIAQDTEVQVAIKACLTEAGIPLPSGNAEQLRTQAWLEGGKVRCAAAIVAKAMAKAAESEDEDEEDEDQDGNGEEELDFDFLRV